MGVGMRLDAVIRKRRMRARLLTKTVSLDIGERWEAVVTRSLSSVLYYNRGRRGTVGYSWHLGQMGEILKNVQHF